MLTQAPKGTKDVAPAEAYKWHFIEDIIRCNTALYGYREVRTPVFEHTELFLRSVGDTTDVVQKEMYTFLDKGDRSITLKPEGTAGAVRAFVEHGLFNEALPLKMYYFTPVFRYERPQSGRLREHHQFGVEAFGGSEPTLDAEIIQLGWEVLEQCGVQNKTLHINSIGCPSCRQKYNKALIAYFEARKGELCELCLDRLGRNPMRILDCKVPHCGEIGQDAPVILDYICDECKEHFAGLQSALTAAGMTFEIDPRIVRGLDYYTKTVFEIIAPMADGQNITVCGGGRYDGLVEQIGGKPTCGAGFGMGLERVLLLLEQQGREITNTEKVKVFITVGGGAKEREAAFVLVSRLRKAGISADCEHNKRSFKAQFKYADKIGAAYCISVGERELETGRFPLKNMAEGTQQELTHDEILEYLLNK